MAALALLSAPAAGQEAHEDNADSIEFLVARERARMEARPKRLLIQERFHGSSAPDEIDRAVVLWDGLVCITGQSYTVTATPEGRGRNPLEELFVFFDGSKWTLFARRNEKPGGWQGVVSASNPDPRWAFSLATLWQRPVAGEFSLQDLQGADRVLGSEEIRDGCIRVYVGAVPQFSTMLREGYWEKAAGFLGYVVDCARERGWQPVRIREIETHPPEERLRREPGVERVTFIGKTGYVRAECVFDEWVERGACQLPTKVERRIYWGAIQPVDNAGRAVTETITVEGKVSELVDPPEWVRFAGLPDESFGEVGVVADLVRGVTEKYDRRPDTTRRKSRDADLERFVEAGDKAGGRGVDGGAGVLWAVALACVVGCGCAMTARWLWRRVLRGRQERVR